MLSELHEQLVNDLGTVLSLALLSVYPDVWEVGGFWFTPDAAIANPFLETPKTGGRTISADMYIFPGDLSGVILVEIGDTKVGKWNFLKHDGMPVRVLRITKDRAFGLLNRRNTGFETDLLNALEDWYHDIDALHESHLKKQRQKNNHSTEAAVNGFINEVGAVSAEVIPQDQGE